MGLGAIAITPYVIPQNRDFAELLYRESVRMLGWSDSAKLLHPITPDPRFLVIGLFILVNLYLWLIDDTSLAFILSRLPLSGKN